MARPPRRTSRPAALIALLASIGLAWGGFASAREPGDLERLGAVALRAPRGWIRAEATDHERTSSRDAGPRVIAAWARPHGGASLNVAVQPGHVDVHPARLRLGRAELEAALAREGRPSGDVRILDAHVTDIGGESAYRVETISGIPGARLRQTQVLLSGPDTYVLTFSVDEAVLGEVAREVEDAIRSVRLERRAGLIGEMPAWLCGGVLGLAAGAAAASRRRRGGARQRSAVGDPSGSCPEDGVDAEGPGPGSGSRESSSSKRSGTYAAYIPSGTSASRAL